MPTEPTSYPEWATATGTTIIGSLNVDNINWQSGNTVRYTFSGSPDLSGVSPLDSLVITGATNILNDGSYIISAVNNASDWIEVTNTAITDATNDESGSPATGTATTAGAVITEPTTAKKQQGWRSPEKPPDGYFNWYMKLVYQWIEFFNEGGASAITQYDTLADLIAVDTGTLVDLTLHMVKDYGVYKLDKSSTDTADGQYILDPTTGSGRYSLVLAHPNMLLLRDATTESFLMNYLMIDDFIRINDKQSYQSWAFGGSPSYPSGSDTLSAYVTFNSDSDVVAPLFVVKSGTGPAVLYTAKSRGTIQTPTGVLDADVIGGFRVAGYDGTGWNLNGGRYQLSAAGNWSSTSTGTQHIFSTVQIGTTSPAFALLIENTKTSTFYGSQAMSANNTYNMFSASLAPANGWIVNPWTVTSDPRDKDITSNFDLGLDFLKALKEENALINWKWKDFEIEKEVIKEIDIDGIEKEVIKQEYINEVHNRVNAGYDASKVLKVMDSFNISTSDYALVTIENYKTNDEKKYTDILSRDNEDLGKLGMRQEALIPVLHNAIYELLNEIESLKERIEILENN